MSSVKTIITFGFWEAVVAVVWAGAEGAAPARIATAAMAKRRFKGWGIDWDTVFLVGIIIFRDL
jgi:hypothetical protein